MSINNPYEKYKNNAIFTATKEELTLMLYDGALKYCNQAIDAIENKNIQNAHNLILKVEEIIDEFKATLNYKYEISKNFNSLYEYMYRRLTEANATKNKEILFEVRDLLREFRDTWKEAMKKAKQESRV